ncbi:MAG TPA: twin-arginine translocation signal domain-containing protein [Acidimicrobiales bacterium]|nr:twin-arginine translocation signal domain-containing protein [Acidimicrobiales bacterium]
MERETGTEGLSRRDVLKRSAVVGGLVWVAPTVLSSSAGATSNLANCAPSSRFALKHGAPNEACETPGTNPTTGNCSASAGFTSFRDGCCLESHGLITFSESGNHQTHTYVLASGVELAGAFAKCATDCIGYSPSSSVITVTTDPSTGKTTVTITCSNLSHSEIVVCFSGSNAPNCP